ncbi:type V toxin-antitoxin system endoribonuclease antitoxin GhoS [Paraburkholderia sp. Tr-20389]|uniref:type V toxin-antitoxin system endoribonuclease antitoxin GhoS n=1 Tax=Paraburkholderia sp. Tr-20389 TaxID=2703903 RepID=UPI0019813E0E|nr:type V toxin-antitoxin system endoribonuclease antitoxin GhoS [Paraburkholderia sp. Tr-20389]MBN3755904.1 type V toxin-antitoxin system endoribonuclease antitoxin GhoS [Paraburkholderia sp. Tr-20389]
MANSYLTRVELHNANASDYQNLHAAMAAQKFMRTIPNDEGVRYQLPTAEYYSVAEIDTNAVLELAKLAVASIGKTGSIITVQFNDARWNGLPTA